MANNPYNLFKRKTTLPYGIEPVEPQQTVQTPTQAPVQPTTLYKPNDPTNLEHLGEKRAAEPTQPKQSKLDEKWGRILGGLQKPQEETQPVSEDTAGMDYINSMYTSPQQEEKYRKASVNRQRILALGDALRHIGNIYHTVKYAPSQQFNNPVGEEYHRYAQDKAIRDANNQKVYSYQQQKAAQEAQQRRWEAEQARKDRDYDFKVKDSDRNFNYKVQTGERDFQEKKRVNDANIERTKAQTEQTRKNTEWIAPLKQAQINNYNSQIWKRSQDNARANYRLLTGGGGRRSGGGRSSGGSGSSGGYQYATPSGHISSKKNFTSTQIGQVFAQFPSLAKNVANLDEMKAAGVNVKNGTDVKNYIFGKMLSEYQDVADFVTQRYGWEAFDDDIPEPGPSIFQRARSRFANFNSTTVPKARTRANAAKSKSSVSATPKNNKSNRSGFFN